MINGGVKFFEKNEALKKHNSTIVASSNNAGAKLCIDGNIYTKWVSDGSNDTIDEQIDITFSGARNIDRVYLLGHNWKEYEIKYFNGVSYSHFSNVLGIDGAAANISELTYARNCSYYEFTIVNTTAIRIIAKKTQTPNQEKFIETIGATLEIGTFQGFPVVSNVSLDRNISLMKTLSNKVMAQKTAETFSCEIVFKNYPLQNDIDILATLHDRELPFNIWLCGGRGGTPYFKLEQRGWRLQDIKTVQIVSDLDSNFSKGIYNLGADLKVKFSEAI